MKIKNLIAGMALSSIILLMISCKKDAVTPSVAQVEIKIDYLGAGGLYNDNMAGVPSGLVVGTNGPYSVAPNQSYTLSYRADSNYPVVQIASFTPTTSSTWVVHCYVQGNQEHIETYPLN